MTAKNLPKKGPGRPKGSANKITKNIKQAIEEAFNNAGGVEYLEKLAKDDPRTFVPLLAKLLPLQVAGDADNPIAHVHKIERVIVRPKD